MALQFSCNFLHHSLPVAAALALPLLFLPFSLSDPRVAILYRESSFESYYRFREGAILSRSFLFSGCLGGGGPSPTSSRHTFRFFFPLYSAQLVVLFYRGKLLRRHVMTQSFLKVSHYSIDMMKFHFSGRIEMRRNANFTRYLQFKTFNNFLLQK